MSTGPAPRPKGKFTGKHMTMILVAGFGVVFAVNFAMASLASSTFGGIVVENSYVASQHFNRWLDEAEKERELGWTLKTTRLENGKLSAHLAGAPRYATVTAEARHPLGHMPDVMLTFERDVSGELVSDKPLPEGRWTLRYTVESEGHRWRSEQAVQ